MAIWQFGLRAYPDKMLHQHFGCTPSILDLDKAEEMGCWAGYAISAAFLQELGEVLPEQKSWSANIKQFGALDESCVEISVENGKIQDLTIRIDVRKLPLKLIDFFLTSFPVAGLTVYAMDGCRILSQKSLLSKINKSPAAKFIENPIAYLEGLKEEE